MKARCPSEFTQVLLLAIAKNDQRSLCTFHVPERRWLDLLLDLLAAATQLQDRKEASDIALKAATELASSIKTTDEWPIDIERALREAEDRVDRKLKAMEDEEHLKKLETAIKEFSSAAEAFISTKRHAEHTDPRQATLKRSQDLFEEKLEAVGSLGKKLKENTGMDEADIARCLVTPVKNEPPASPPHSSVLVEFFDSSPSEVGQFHRFS